MLQCRPAKQKMLSKIEECSPDHPSMLKSVKVYDGNPVENQSELRMHYLLELKWKAFIGNAVRKGFSTKQVSGPRPQRVGLNPLSLW